jgi:hypothetical protein
LRLIEKPSLRPQGERHEPKLADPVLALGVNVRRFVAVETEKEKTVRAWNPLDGRHLLSS